MRSNSMVRGMDALTVDTHLPIEAAVVVGARHGGERSLSVVLVMGVLVVEDVVMIVMLMVVMNWIVQRLVSMVRLEQRIMDVMRLGVMMIMVRFVVIMRVMTVTVETVVEVDGVDLLPVGVTVLVVLDRTEELVVVMRVEDRVQDVGRVVRVVVVLDRTEDVDLVLLAVEVGGVHLGAVDDVGEPVDGAAVPLHADTAHAVVAASARPHAVQAGVKAVPVLAELAVLAAETGVLVLAATPVAHLAVRAVAILVVDGAALDAEAERAAGLALAGAEAVGVVQRALALAAPVVADLLVPGTAALRVDHGAGQDQLALAIVALLAGGAEAPEVLLGALVGLGDADPVLADLVVGTDAVPVG